MSVDRIRLSEAAKDQLVKLKRTTKIVNWNVLCRWAFCLSLREPSIPADSDIPSDSNVEMTWGVFGGADADIYLGLLKARCKRDGFALDDDVLNHQFRLHLHRGIGYLAGDRTLHSTPALVGFASQQAMPHDA